LEKSSRWRILVSRMSFEKLDGLRMCLCAKGGHPVLPVSKPFWKSANIGQDTHFTAGRTARFQRPNYNRRNIAFHKIRLLFHSSLPFKAHSQTPFCIMLRFNLSNLAPQKRGKKVTIEYPSIIQVDLISFIYQSVSN